MKVIDMHCDTITELLRLKKMGEDDSLYKNRLHMDICKMQYGDYMLQNFAIFTNLKKVDPILHVQESIDLYYRELEKNKDYLRPVFSYHDREENRKKGYMSAMLTFEEGDVVLGNLAMLRNYYRLGVRMITLTWNHKNRLGYPNVLSRPNMTHQDIYKANTKDGLTPFGKAYIQEMEKLGIIIDVSHLSDAGFYDVLRYTTKPFVASHSNARTVCPAARNLTDDMIKQIAKRRGVIGINFYGDFLVASKQGDAPSTIAVIIKHMRHIISIGGIECIGLGSDFDGISGSLEIADASFLPKLYQAMQKEGFSQEEIEAIFYKNVLRLYKQILT